MQTNINLELHNFLHNVETQLFVQYRGKNSELIAIAFINFNDLREFQEAVDCTSIWCDDCGIDVKLQDGNICIELNEIFECEGNTILDYKDCFEQDKIKEFEKWLNTNNEGDY